jgi:hypothetical protein
VVATTVAFVDMLCVASMVGVLPVSISGSTLCVVCVIVPAILRLLLPTRTSAVLCPSWGPRMPLTCPAPWLPSPQAALVHMFN